MLPSIGDLYHCPLWVINPGKSILKMAPQLGLCVQNILKNYQIITTSKFTKFVTQILIKDNITQVILPDFGKNGVNSLPKKEVLNYVEGFLKTF